MSNITQLDQSTINKIAAGEVIERPAAVVKELVENAIDAGASAITVEIKNGGISFIRVTDNGMGIEKNEVPTAFLRHATSKIKSVEDLLSVSSLGFRGEALSSIAAVSQVELITKTGSDLSGLRYVVDGGTEKGSEEIGCPTGSTFIIRNLFYNTPARRKYLKSAVTEAGYINELMDRLACAHGEISFKFINNNQIRLQSSGNNNQKDIIYHIYGRGIAGNLLEVNNKSDHGVLEGFIGKPVISRGNRNYQNYYINGRYIKSAVINKAIEEAYKPFIMNHRYSFTVLHFIIEKEFLDVNVHPTKMEVRFKNSEEIYSLAFHGIRDALTGKELIPDVTLNTTKEDVKEVVKTPEPFEFIRRAEFNLKNKNEPSEVTPNDKVTMKQENDSNQEVIKKDIYSHSNKGNLKAAEGTWIEPNADIIIKPGTYAGSNKETSEKDINLIQQTEIGKLNQVVQMGTLLKEDHEYGNEDKVEQMSLFEDPLLSKEARGNHRIIGQLFSTYWIIEYRDKMFIIDQHAAHEKVLFEKTMRAIRNKEYASQMLHPPIIITLTMREEEVLNRCFQILNQIGFEIEHFGGREYSVRAVPGDMLGIAHKELLVELIDSLLEEEHKENLDMILERAASFSCKGAVKGNSRLSYMEASALIDQLLELENPYHCPHGRPTIISMSKYEIEKKFKRII